MAAMICVNVIQITRKENIKTFSDWEFKFSQLPINSCLPFVSFCHFMLSKVIDSFSVQTNICNAKTHITMRTKLLIYEKKNENIVDANIWKWKIRLEIWIESTNSEKKTENICPLFSIHICWCYCNCGCCYCLCCWCWCESLWFWVFQYSVSSKCISHNHGNFNSSSGTHISRAQLKNMIRSRLSFFIEEYWNESLRRS